MNEKADRGFRAVFLIFAIAGIAFFPCDCNKSVNNPSLPNTPPPEGDFIVFWDDFINQTDSIVLFKGTCDCINDSLHSSIGRYSYYYVLNDQSLSIQSNFTQSATCTTEYYLGFSRLSGSSLIGNWLFDSAWYEIKGSAIHDDSASADSMKKQILNQAFVWIMIDSVDKKFARYCNPDTNLFTTNFLINYKAFLDSNHLTADSISPNSLMIIGKSFKPLPDTTSVFDTLTITNYYRNRTTVYRTSDTTKYSPDPYVFESSTMCASRLFPPWINKFVKDNRSNGSSH